VAKRTVRVTRDAGTGRFVPPRRAVTHPTRTVTETVKKGKGK
jgi:hypothetical protein